MRKERSKDIRSPWIMLQGISKCVCGGWWALQGICGAIGMVRGLYEYKPGPQHGGASWNVNLWDLRQL